MTQPPRIRYHKPASHHPPEVERPFGNHVRFDVTFLVEELRHPIGTNASRHVSNLFKAISNREAARLSLFIVEKAESLM
jgi:hypothetical protein